MLSSRPFHANSDSISFFNSFCLRIGMFQSPALYHANQSEKPGCPGRWRLWESILQRSWNRGMVLTKYPLSDFESALLRKLSSTFSGRLHSSNLGSSASDPHIGWTVTRNDILLRHWPISTLAVFLPCVLFFLLSQHCCMARRFVYTE